VAVLLGAEPAAPDVREAQIDPVGDGALELGATRGEELRADVGPRPARELDRGQAPAGPPRLVEDDDLGALLA